MRFLAHKKIIFNLHKIHYKMKFILLITLIPFLCFSQTISINTGGFINIESNSSFSIGGLELAPTNSYVISGPNVISFDSTPITVGDYSSINRVYNFSTDISNYLGLVSFNYEESELNDISESDLILQVLDLNALWLSLDPVRDPVNNSLSYNFIDPIGFSKVTASDISASLSIATENINNYTSIYPNPTSDKLFIVSNFFQKAILFNALGIKILETDESELNIVDLPSGVYLLRTISNQNKISTFKIIKK